MLEIRCVCEHCETALPPESTEAMICTYECTFCNRCVADVLNNVCPNCGGGFCQRPIRPRTAWLPGVSLEHQPAATDRVVKPVDPEQQQRLLARVGKTPAERR